MDYNDILFGLQPLLNAASITDVPVESVYLESYLTVLDQLAVSLRAPANRDVVGQTGLLSNLLRVLCDTLDNCFTDAGTDSQKVAYFRIASELIRSIANTLVDNDANREIFMGSGLTGRNQITDYYVGRILNLIDLPLGAPNDLLSNLQTRTVVMIRNLCLDNEEYMKRVATFVRGPLLSMLRANQHVFQEDPDSVVLGADLLSEFIELDAEGFTLGDELFLSKVIQNIANVIPNDIVISEEADHENEVEADPAVDILFSLTHSLENIVKYNDEHKVVLHDAEEIVSAIQNSLFNALDILDQKEFQNKLIIMRRIVASAGFISANESNSNKNEQELCVSKIKNSRSGYTLALSFIILSNSINSKADADNLERVIKIDDIINAAAYLTDPMQFQGYLDLLKKTLTLTNAMFLSKDLLMKLSAVLKICHDQGKYFQNLTPLLQNLLKKLISVLPSKSVQDIIQDRAASPMLELVTESGSLIACLALDKLLVTRIPSETEVLAELWNTVFQFNGGDNQNNGLSINILFQITKTMGIYLKNTQEHDTTSNILFQKHSEQLLLIMDTILPMKDDNSNGAVSVYNNGKFIAGMVLNILKNTSTLSEQEQDLQNKASAFF